MTADYTIEEIETMAIDANPVTRILSSLALTLIEIVEEPPIDDHERAVYRIRVEGWLEKIKSIASDLWHSYSDIPQADVVALMQHTFDPLFEILA